MLTGVKMHNGNAILGKASQVPPRPHKVTNKSIKKYEKKRREKIMTEKGIFR